MWSEFLELIDWREENRKRRTIGKIHINNGRYYKKVQAMTGRFYGMYLWQPMKKVLWFYIPDYKKDSFILDDDGFYPIYK